MTHEEVQRLTRLWERQFRDSWLAAIASVKDELTLKQIAELLQAGDVKAAVNLISAKVGQWFQAQWLPAFMESATAASLFLQEALDIPIVFDGTNWKAVSELQAHRLRLVVGFNEQQTNAAMQALERAYTTGENPLDVARAFRDSIGLTDTQEAAVANYRRLLEQNKTSEILGRELRDRRFDPTVERAGATRTPLSGPQIDRMVGRYRERMINFRAETIARTESLRAVHSGQDAMYRQAIEEGSLQVDQLERTWATAKDERVRTSHAFMHGQKRGPLEPFVSGKDNELLYPGDASAPVEDTAQCRCSVGARITKIVLA
jgi:hypothetical protein